MSDIGPGDWVECVDDSPDRFGNPLPLLKGALYQIAHIWSDIYDERDGSYGDAYDLVGFDRMEGNIAFDARRFRPIRDEGERFMEKLKVGVPVRERV